MAHLIASKVGEGFGRSESDVPIDIQCGDVVDWLMSRKKIPQDWKQKVEVVKAKAEVAKAQLPEEISSWVVRNELPYGYFTSKEIREKLAVGAERTFMGGLTGQAALWDKIVRAYETGGICLGEAAQTLARTVEYEIPYLKKQVVRYQQLMEDAQKRHDESLKSAAMAAQAYKQQCVDMGIDEAKPDIQQQLMSHTQKLPGMLQEAVDALRASTAAEAIQYYSDFIEYAHCQLIEGQASDVGSASACTTLVEVLEDRTQPQEELPCSSARAEDLGPVGDVGGGDAAVPALIDWDLDAAVADASAAGDAAPAISWDIGVVEDMGGGADAAVGVQESTVSWDIDLSAGGEAAESLAPAARSSAAEAADAAEGTGGGDEDASVVAARLTSDGEYRNAVLDDLHELQAFLRQRVTELSGGAQSDLLSAMAPPAVQNVTADTAGSFLQSLASCMDAFTSAEVQKLLLIRGSRRYRQRLVQQLRSQGEKEGKLKQAAEDAMRRYHDAQRSLMRDAARVKQLAERCHTYRAYLQTAMPKLLGGRPINVQMPHL